MSLAYEIIDKEHEEHFEINQNAPIIHCTTDYEIFKPMKGNRPISKKNVRNLLDSLLIVNLLPHQPITVDENLQVLDGQHRLAAAKELGLPVYYTICPGANYKIAGVLNQSRKGWTFIDDLENYAKNGLQDYVNLNEFLEMHDMSLKRFKLILSKKQQKTFEEDLRLGKFKIEDDLNELSKKADMIQDIVKFLERIILLENKRFLKTDNFWKALYILLLKKDIDVLKFKEKLSIKHQSICQMPGYKSYLKLLSDIYNWKTKVRLK